MEPESPAVASLPPLASTLAAAAKMMTESDSPKKKQSSYSKENKIKRYDAILREFMTHFHGRSEAEGGVYPANHEFSNEELSAIQPQDIGELFLF